jgi:hypothetical protein
VLQRSVEPTVKNGRLDAGLYQLQFEFLAPQMHATGCRCVDHWHTTDGSTQRNIAALDLYLAQEHIERAETFSA